MRFTMGTEPYVYFGLCCVKVLTNDRGGYMRPPPIDAWPVSTFTSKVLQQISRFLFIYLSRVTQVIWGWLKVWHYGLLGLKLCYS